MPASRACAREGARERGERDSPSLGLEESMSGHTKSPRAPRGIWTKKKAPPGFRWLRAGEVIAKGDFVNESGIRPETGRPWGFTRTWIGGTGCRAIGPRVYARRNTLARCGGA